MRELGRYAYVNARVRAMLSHLLNADQWQSLYESPNLSSLVMRLDSDPYAGWFKGLSNREIAQSLEKNIFIELVSIEKKISSYLEGPPADLIGIMSEQYDIEQIKRGLRCWSQRKPFNVPEEGSVSGRNDIDWDIFNGGQHIDKIISALNRTSFSKALQDGKEMYMKTKSVFFLEAALERNYFAGILEKTKLLSSNDKKCVTKLIGMQIDILNIKNLIRSRLYFKLPPALIKHVVYPGGRHIKENKCFECYLAKSDHDFIKGLAVKPFAQLNKLISEQELKDASSLLMAVLYKIFYKEIKNTLRGFPFSLGIPIAYILLYRWELKQIQALFWSKYLGVTEDISTANPIVN